MHPAKISLGIHPVWSVFEVCMKKAKIECQVKTNQSGQMSRLIWVLPSPMPNVFKDDNININIPYHHYFNQVSLFFMTFHHTNSMMTFILMVLKPWQFYFFSVLHFNIFCVIFLQFITKSWEMVLYLVIGLHTLKCISYLPIKNN